MSAPPARQDVHRSSRTIDLLSGVLNDYCEAATALAAVRKKLAKTLRDAAALKTNPQFAANAFGASSLVLDVLADVDNKFARIAEKEAHAVSAEVKKWLKKLAKEEKAHDERMSESNARIKQAGQVYEKKSKKGAKDAGEEHARYVNLLSVIGPEMSQEKQNHAVHVAQQNTLVTFGVAASVSRMADAEWIRACECMRRISPTVGSLGEWRSLCEAAWTGSLPDGLPDLVSGQPSIPPAVSEWGQTGLSTPLRRSLPTPPATNHSPGSVSSLATTSLDPPRSPFAAATPNQGSLNSITTLSAFPFPPTHMPLPLATSESELQRQQIRLHGLQSPRSRAGTPDPMQQPGVLAPSAPIFTESPKRMAAALPESLAPDASTQSLRTPPPLPSDTRAPEALPRSEPLALSEDQEPIKPAALGEDAKKPRRPSLITRVPPPSDKVLRPASPFKRADHALTEKDFGTHADAGRGAIKSHTVDTAKKNLERADSTQSTNIVAALRHRYTRTVEIPSQAPKDVPRLPMSVSEIASRYQPADEPLSPRRTTFPVADQFPPDTPARASARDLPVDEGDIRRRKQRIEELAELELKEKEYELRQRERELDQRARDFERDRFQFLHSRPEPGNASDGPRGPRQSNRPFQHKRGSQSVTHFSTTGTASSSGVSAASPTRPSTAHSPSGSQLLPAKDHAPFCGCDTCSVSKYRTADAPPSPRDLRPPEPPILLRPEKPKGWIRRLSMPSVNVAFSLDGKKSASAVSLKAGFPFPAENGRLRKRSFEPGVSNRTVTGTGR